MPAGHRRAQRGTRAWSMPMGQSVRRRRMMTIYQILKAEFAKTLKLLNLLVDTTASQPEERENLLHQVREQLRSQYAAEAASLYPLLLHEARTEVVASACRYEK